MRRGRDEQSVMLMTRYGNEGDDDTCACDDKDDGMMLLFNGSMRVAVGRRASCSAMCCAVRALVFPLTYCARVERSAWPNLRLAVAVLVPVLPADAGCGSSSAVPRVSLWSQRGGAATDPRTSCVATCRCFHRARGPDGPRCFRSCIAAPRGGPCTLFCGGLYFALIES